MSARTSMARMLAGPEEWNRRRLQVLLGVAALVVAAVVVGIVWSVIEILDTGAAEDTPAIGSGTANRESVAAATAFDRRRTAGSAVDRDDRHDQDPAAVDIGRSPGRDRLPAVG